MPRLTWHFEPGRRWHLVAAPSIHRYAEETMKSRIAIAVFVIIFLSYPLNVAAQSKFITFGVPGASTTTPLIINPAGVIVGWYSGANLRGFLRERHGAIITFDVPGASTTTPLSINPAGVIAGSYGDANFVSHGFLRERHGAIITFDVPGVGSGGGPPAAGTHALSI